MNSIRCYRVHTCIPANYKYFSERQLKGDYTRVLLEIQRSDTPSFCPKHSRRHRTTSVPRNKQNLVLPSLLVPATPPPSPSRARGLFIPAPPTERKNGKISSDTLQKIFYAELAGHCFRFTTAVF